LAHISKRKLKKCCEIIFMYFSFWCLQKVSKKSLSGEDGADEGDGDGVEDTAYKGGLSSLSGVLLPSLSSALRSCERGLCCTSPSSLSARGEGERGTVSAAARTGE
jgi:hypothetical protein